MNRTPRARDYLFLFLALTLIYHSNLRPIPAGDSLPSALVPISLVLDHSLSLDRFGPWIQEHLWFSRSILRAHGGHWHSVYPVVGPALLAPLYLPLAFVPGLRRLPPDQLIAIARILEKFSASALAAAAVLWMLALLLRLAPPRWAWALCGIFALGTGVWSTASQALWQHTFGLVALVACFYELDRGRLFRCGLWAALALLMRPTNALLPLALVIALWSQRTSLSAYLRLLGPVAAGGAFAAAYNWTALGGIAGGYETRFDSNPLSGLAGLLVSPGRGLFVYTPVILFAAACLAPAARSGLLKHRPVAVASATFILLHLALLSLWPVWWGGYSWGCRMLSEILPGLFVLLAMAAPALVTRRVRRLFAAAALYGIAIQALGVYFYPQGHWDSQPVSVDAAPSRLWSLSDNPIFRTARAGPALEPYELVVTAFRQGLPAARKRMGDLGVGAY